MQTGKSTRAENCLWGVRTQALNEEVIYRYSVRASSRHSRTIRATCLPSPPETRLSFFNASTSRREYHFLFKNLYSVSAYLPGNRDQACCVILKIPGHAAFGINPSSSFHARNIAAISGPSGVSSSFATSFKKLNVSAILKTLSR